MLKHFALLALFQTASSAESQQQAGLSVIKDLASKLGSSRQAALSVLLADPLTDDQQGDLGRVQGILDDIRQEIVGLVGDLRSDVMAPHGDFHQCEIDHNAAEDTTTFPGLSTAHSSCRSTESGLDSDMTTDCGRAETEVRQLTVDACNLPDLVTDWTAWTQAHHDEWHGALTAGESKYSQHKNVLELELEKCQNATTARDSHCNAIPSCTHPCTDECQTCHNHQTAYENAICDAKSTIDGNCQSLTGCYDQHEGTYNSNEAGWIADNAGYVNDQALIFQIKCFISALQAGTPIVDSNSGQCLFDDTSNLIERVTFPTNWDRVDCNTAVSQLIDSGVVAGFPGSSAFVENTPGYTVGNGYRAVTKTCDA